MKINIALSQSNIQFGDPEHNFAFLSEQAAQASVRQADLLLFPELALHGYHRASITDAVDWHLPHLLTRLQDLARTNHVALAGSCVEEADGHRFNTMVFIDSAGNLLGKYRKTHLFKKLNEDKFFLPGNDLTVVDTDWGRLGLAICYDLRFPEIFRAMMRKGAQGYLICAEWPSARINHWKTLLQARAIENQAWIAACNCTGISGKVEFGGASSTVTPWGEISTADNKEGLIFSTIHTEQVDEIRAENPFLDDYRGDLN